MTTLNQSTEAKTTIATGKAPKIEKKSVKDALKAFRSQVRVVAGLPSESKASAKKAKIADNKASKKAELLKLLTEGRESNWTPVRALEKAVQAIKLGATPLEMQTCKSLLNIADWPALEENVRLYATTVNAPADLVVVALCDKARISAPKANPIVAPKLEPAKESSKEPIRIEKRASVSPIKPAKSAKVA